MKKSAFRSTFGLMLTTSVILSSPYSLANPFEKTLSNGLKVIVKEDHRAPTVAHMVWYRAGSIDEIDGTTGVAHVLEHMMFKGTKKVGPGEFNQRVAEAGGRDNAYTTRDYTAYFQQVPKARLGAMMELEADRMANLKIDPKEFAKEIQVVMEERRMRTDDKPHAQVGEALNAVAYTTHPYRRPIIGWMADLEAMTAQDAQHWYHTWYAPNNAYLVIVGDVDKDEVFKQAEKYYGPLKPHALPDRRKLEEPTQKGERRIVVKAPAELPFLLMSWRAPKLVDLDKDRDAYAIEVLANILDGNDASRFGKNLVRGKRIATSTEVDYVSELRGLASFDMEGTPAEGHTVAELEAAMRAEIADIAKNGVSNEELERVKIQSIASQVFKRDSMFGQAMEIGATEASGHSYKDIDRILDKLRSVTAAEVQSVAQRYFGSDTLSVAVLEPQPMDPKAPPKKPGVPLKH